VTTSLLKTVYNLVCSPARFYRCQFLYLYRNISVWVSTAQKTLSLVCEGQLRPLTRSIIRVNVAVLCPNIMCELFMSCFKQNHYLSTTFVKRQELNYRKIPSHRCRAVPCWQKDRQKKWG